MERLVVNMLPSHYESSAIIRAPADRVFEFVDNHAAMSAHMGRHSWRMGWNRMDMKLDESQGKSVGSHIRLGGIYFRHEACGR